MSTDPQYLPDGSAHYGPGQSPVDPNGFTIEAEAYEPQEPPTYDEAFPPMPPMDNASAGGRASRGVSGRGRGPSYAKMAVKSSTITQVFHVPLEERRYKEMNQGFGESGSQSSKICADIMKNYNASIEMSLAKDQSLTIVVTGKEDAVMKARREVMNKLQTQANIQIAIPKDHHRFIIGKEGKKLKELETITMTKITIPNTEDSSDLIRIQGPKEGIDQAKHELQLISDEQAKRAFERLIVPYKYHPFICGPENCFIQELSARTGAKISVPPLSARKDEIVVAGEKDGVHEAKAVILRTYEEKKLKTTTVSLEVRKSQHRYVIGPRGSNLADILKETGVSVEVPPTDSTSETITLRGEQNQLGPAITQVYAKANSIKLEEVYAPAWLHRFIIGRQGKNVKNITQNLPKVHVEFQEGRDVIAIEGPPEEVEKARSALEEISRDLQSRLSFDEIDIDPKYHKHIIGKAGANITRIKKETGVSIRIPSDEEKSSKIRIEGSPEGIDQAKKELLEIAQRLENEKSRDILIEHRFHRTIIGTKGEYIKDIRDKFKQVQIAFPDPGRQSDVVTLRGPKQEVDLCFRFLKELSKELVENNYQISLPIFKKFHKNIIGKGGSTINKIKEETDTRIEIPTESSDSDAIVITGKKANVEKAKQRILAIEGELANITEVEVRIPSKHHQSLIGSKGRLIRAIMEECGGVHIHFPNEGSGSDRVTIRGPKEEVDKAKKQLLDLTNEREQASFTADVHAKREYHRFLIGRGGANIRKVREETGARVVFPNDKDEDQTLIQIIGTKEAVEEAKKRLSSLIKDLDNIVEAEIDVDTKYHRHFVARRGQVLREIGDEYGGVTVSFPRNGSSSTKVAIKGAKNCVEGAKNRILQIVSDLEQQVSIECVIPQRFHGTVMGQKGSRIQSITREHEVNIKFPDRNAPASEPVNGETNGDKDGAPLKQDIIIITGKKENCENAKEALKALVPIVEEVMVPFDYHRYVIGAKGAGVRRMMEDNDVNITIPPASEQSDIVRVRGTPSNVARAVQALKDRVRELDDEQEDRRLRAFTLEISVDPKYHPKIIGRKGAVVGKIRTKHEVNIQFPARDHENQDCITIQGYEANAEAAKEDILAIVKELEEQVVQKLTIDHRIHRRLIGTRGKAINRIMDTYKVDIRFPREDDPDPNLVVVSGEAEAVDECCDYLKNLEEEYLFDVQEEEETQRYTKAPSRSTEEQPKRQDTGFVIRDAPWSKPPDTSNINDFPTIGGPGSASNPAASAPRWGPSFKR
ncbi:vigilin-like [Diadema antillarum]|uniref:vigilin-like n=1 Tax=Diadema antillarum TaxID=105358 RepID=UPI003A856452